MTLSNLIQKAYNHITDYPRICQRCIYWKQSWLYDDEYIKTFYPDRRGLCIKAELDPGLVAPVQGPATAIYPEGNRPGRLATRHDFSCSEWARIDKSQIKD